MENLTSSVSSLALGDSESSKIPLSTSKKYKRPNRAYHTFESSGSGGATSLPQLESPAGIHPTKLGGSQPQLFGASNENFVSQEAALSMQDQQRITSHYVSTQRLEDQQQYLKRSFLTSQDSVPPLATTQFYCVDQGSSDPRQMCLTMYNIPKNEQLRSATKLPMGAVLQPFTDSTPNAIVDLIDTSTTNGPLRCRRCKAYVNPAFSFTFDSNAVCNFCQISTPLDENHYAPLNPNGLRSDFDQRPDLLKGTVEFRVPEKYNPVKGIPNVPLHYVFLIDISTLANENKSSLATIEGVRTCIEYICTNQPNCKIAIIAYDKHIRFFNLRPELMQAQEYIVSELHDVFLPIYNGLFVTPADSMHVIQDTLCKLTAYIEDGKFSHCFEACYGSALDAARIALDTVTAGQGGKIIATLSTKPTIGVGNLSVKTDNALKKTLNCDNDFYKKIGKELLNSSVSVDLFCTSSAFVDMTSVGHPTLVSSGYLKYYPNFHIDKDEFTLVNDMLHSVSNCIGYNAQLKVRCSAGLSIYNYYSASNGYSDREPRIPVLHKDFTMNVLFKYTEQLPVSKNIHFQAALLYTDIDGVRKVRTLNVSGAANDSIHEVFKFVNQDAVVSIIIQDVISTLGNCNFVNIRKLIDDKLSDILTQYRALVSGSSSSQLVLPDSLKTLPAYLLAFEKTEMMKNNNKSTQGNSRVSDFFLYHNFNITQIMFKLYPQILPLHELLGETDFMFYDENDELLQTDSVSNLSVRATRSALIDGGCYLIFDGQTVYLWFNENTNQFLLRDLLGVEPDTTKFDAITLFGGSLPEADTEINMKARNLIKNWRQLVGRSYVPVIPLRPHVDSYYAHVMGAVLCEDKSIEMIESYENYLVSIHRTIKEKLKNEDFVKLNNSKDHEHFSQKFIQF
ncbi:LAFE_0D08086g1_1 [Lachancea fermentati]|uniref:LAFE_0D08086g1_1 n=1 Tax=Lachancea fermentati TaxID=4955 RepID=A0A1G4MBV2_LACFM|nr:LAFE_0D08086g1_1 [Lachancea fermentati]